MLLKWILNDFAVLFCILFFLFWIPKTIHGKKDVETETLVKPEKCKYHAESGDHLMISFSIKDAETSKHIYSLPDYKHQHIELGDSKVLPGLSKGLEGVCKGEVRYIKVPEHLGYGPEKSYLPEISEMMWDGVGTLGFTVTVHYLTSALDYQIFDLWHNKDYAGVVGFVNEHKGNNAVDEWGGTVMMYAVQQGQTLVMAALLNAYRPKSDVNIAKASGHTALMYATLQKESIFMRSLLKLGADPNVSVTHGEKKGWTPLHFACSFDYSNHIKLLLEFGAEPNVKTAEGLHPLDVLPPSVPKGVRRKLAKLFEEIAMKDEL
mmetsp:Transcript_15137/g.19846  ORF Transcript_15137/g.19846 Transcript_15137/m.19846 type:complete len:320 (+) Transcript_15137:190-1149(+)